MDDKHREFVVPDLKPNSEYVISLRAYNNIGDGRPIYETVSKKLEININQAFFIIFKSILKNCSLGMLISITLCISTFFSLKVPID